MATALMFGMKLFCIELMMAGYAFLSRSDDDLGFVHCRDHLVWLFARIGVFAFQFVELLTGQLL